MSNVYINDYNNSIKYIYLIIKRVSFGLKIKIKGKIEGKRKSRFVENKENKYTQERPSKHK